MISAPDEGPEEDLACPRGYLINHHVCSMQAGGVEHHSSVPAAQGWSSPGPVGTMKESLGILGIR